MENLKVHTNLTDLESVGEDCRYRIDKHYLLLDLKVLIKDYYAGFFATDDDALLMCFSNGQTFKLKLEECA